MKKPKTKKQLYFERVIKIIALVFLFGILCGVGTFKLVHNCNLDTVEATETIVDNESIESTEKTEVIAPEPKNALCSLGVFVANAYCCENYPHICNDGDAKYTATGTTPTPGRTIAVDPTVIPYGTPVTIDGHTYIAEDCGGAIKGNRIDILFATHKEALEFGVQYREVFVEWGV